MSSKLENAKRAIEDLFSDTSVSAQETREALEELMEDLEAKIESLSARTTTCVSATTAYILPITSPGKLEGNE